MQGTCVTTVEVFSSLYINKYKDTTYIYTHKYIYNTALDEMPVEKSDIVREVFFTS